MSYVFSVPVYVYDVSQRYDVKVVSSDFVAVWYTDDDVLVIRRHPGVPKEVVSGRGDVVVGLDEWGRIVNIEVEFADFYHINKEEARKILRKARW
jgi:uncharacterized protein YuzE